MSPGSWLPEHVRARLAAGYGTRDGREPARRGAARRIARERMASYGGKLALIDDRLGRLLAVLDGRGWTANTLVIFLSDHGEMGGDHGRYHKSVFYESAARIPFVMRWPAALPAGGRVGALVEQLDLFATVVDAAGAAPLRAGVRPLPAAPGPGPAGGPAGRGRRATPSSPS